MSPVRLRALYFALAAAVVVLDQATKAMIRAFVPLHDRIVVVPGCFDITHVKNTGAAFGLFAGATSPYRPILLNAVAFAVFLLVLVYAFRSPVHWKRLQLALALSVGALLGVGLYTFRFAEGLSYFSTDPKACANCHIMNSQYDSWQKSSHHIAARCVDCHLPHDFFSKYLAKAENGYHHSKGFTLQDFPEPIQIKEKNSRILQENCVRCHEGLVEDVVQADGHGGGEVHCVKCHREVGHGPR